MQLTLNLKQASEITAILNTTEAMVKYYLHAGRSKMINIFEGRCALINKNGTLTFSMTEKIGGLMFPMYAKYIPPFDKSFEQFAGDLKKESETIMDSK